MEILPADGGEQLSPISKPYLRKTETLNVVSPAGAMQPSGFDGRQDLDRRHPNLTLFNLHSTGADAHV